MNGHQLLQRELWARPHARLARLDSVGGRQGQKLDLDFSSYQVLTAQSTSDDRTYLTLIFILYLAI